LKPTIWGGGFRGGVGRAAALLGEWGRLWAPTNHNHQKTNLVGGRRVFVAGGRAGGGVGLLGGPVGGGLFGGGRVFVRGGAGFGWGWGGGGGVGGEGGGGGGLGGSVGGVGDFFWGGGGGGWGTHKKKNTHPHTSESDRFFLTTLIRAMPSFPFTLSGTDLRSVSSRSHRFPAPAVPAILFFFSLPVTLSRGQEKLSPDPTACAAGMLAARRRRVPCFLIFLSSALSRQLPAPALRSFQFYLASSAPLAVHFPFSSSSL